MASPNVCISMSCTPVCFFPHLFSWGALVWKQRVFSLQRFDITEGQKLHFMMWWQQHCCCLFVPHLRDCSSTGSDPFAGTKKWSGSGMKYERKSNLRTFIRHRIISQMKVSFLKVALLNVKWSHVVSKLKSWTSSRIITNNKSKTYTVQTVWF